MVVTYSSESILIREWFTCISESILIREWLMMGKSETIIKDFLARRKSARLNYRNKMALCLYNRCTQVTLMLQQLLDKYNGITQNRSKLSEASLDVCKPQYKFSNTFYRNKILLCYTNLQSSLSNRHNCLFMAREQPVQFISGTKPLVL